MESFINRAKSEKNKRIMFVVICIFLFTILIYLFFANLGRGNLQDWDEARHGVNAYEMTERNNYIGTTYNYEVDYYNLKPPLSDYFIVFGYKVFGYNLFGLRFYSAASMLILCIICFVYALKKWGKAAAIWILVGFGVSQQLFMYHCGRHGDADALFILLYTGCALGLLINKENMRGIYISCLCFSAAFLCKSWHAITCAALICTYLLINFKSLSLNVKKILTSILCALGPIIIWGVLRFQFDGTKFFEWMINYDLLNRSASALEGHNGSVLYYFEKIIKYKSTYIMALPVIVAIGLEKKNIVKSKNKIIAGLAVAIPVVLFSVAKTKLEWYTFCIFPMAIIISAYGLSRILKVNSFLKHGFISVLGVVSIFMIYKNIMNINNIEVDSTLYSNSVFRMVERTDVYEKKTIFIYTDDGKWTQKDLLATELAGNMKCEDGGYDSWKNLDGAYLAVSKEKIQQIPEKYEIISNYEDYFIIKK